MQLTVCICTHNRPHYLRDCLNGLTRQTTGPSAFATLVVDSGSTGSVPAEMACLVAALPNASLIRVDRPGVSAARNAGAAACRTPYIAYIDDDAIPARRLGGMHPGRARRDHPAALPFSGAACCRNGKRRCRDWWPT